MSSQSRSAYRDLWGSKYMSCRLVSDSDQSVMRDFETIVSLVTHSSVLRNDDVRLKGAPLGASLSDKCDLAALDDARHLVMQCPDLQRQRGDIMGEIAGLEGGFGPAIPNSGEDLLYVLLGKTVEGFTWEQMVSVWKISSKHTASMYKAKIKSGTG